MEGPQSQDPFVLHPLQLVALSAPTLRATDVSSSVQFFHRGVQEIQESNSYVFVFLSNVTGAAFLEMFI